MITNKIFVKLSKLIIAGMYGIQGKKYKLDINDTILIILL